MPAETRSPSASASSSSGQSVAVTPSRPTSRGRDSATGPIPATSGSTVETDSTACSSPLIAATMRASPPPIPYQVAPLPSMIV